MRDYLYIYDCAELILDVVDRALDRSDGSTPSMTVKNLISGRAVTISALLGVMRSIVKAHPHVMLGASASAAFQAVDLRLASVVWPDLDARTLTTLDVGIDATLRDVLARVQAAGR
ncbi:hypothetical protein ACGGZK_16700 [Agromyces sp. MMS24-K17]|uniref:hypothetical protein n=1 Tax=Agromyces sp. MMS24-K17 TaxID=3372850 RepID=UPI0037549674